MSETAILSLFRKFWRWLFPRDMRPCPHDWKRYRYRCRYCSCEKTSFRVWKDTQP